MEAHEDTILQGDILNEAEVEFLLKGAENDSQPQSAPSLDEDEHTVTMRGDLDQINLSDIFQTLAMSQMEGVLRVRNALEERQVYCRDSYVRILVPNRVTLRRLGNRLVHAGLIDGDQLRQALVEQKSQRIPLGELLVRDGFVTQDQLDEIVGMQVAEDLFSLFTWRYGTFDFFRADGDGEKMRESFTHCPEYEINSLLLEVARRSDEWETILDELQSLDEVPGQVDDAVDVDDLSETHQFVLRTIKGRATYRQLSDLTTLSLFEFCRAARDLSAGGIIAPIEDDAFLDLASELINEGEQKRAVVLLQTLRDRPGDRTLEAIRTMAQLLGQLDERKLASQLLLEAAQRSPVPEQALQLARDARAMVPYDPGTLSFLRTVLVAHSDPDSSELEQCTLDLIDALIENDLVPTAIEIIDDARMTDTMRPQILMREARARQKTRDTAGAVQCLEQLVEHYQTVGNRAKVLESMQAILKLDRERKDIARQIAQMQRTRVQRIARIVAAALVLVMAASSGVVWWQKSAFDAAVGRAVAEVEQLLDEGDHVQAGQRIDHWLADLGESDALVDLQNRVRFAQAAEKKRLAELARADLLEKLRSAASMTEDGDLRQAMQIYERLHERPERRTEVVEHAGVRVDRVLAALETSASALRSGVPQKPDELLGRGDLQANRQRLEQAMPTALQKGYMALRAMHTATLLPEFLGAERRYRIQTLFADRGDLFELALTRVQQYDEALARSDTQQRLDPTFQAAVAKEQAHDFRGALELYRKLEGETLDDPELKTHFGERVTRNATIARLLDELQAATGRGDYQTAFQHLKALRASFGDVAFDQFVRLPLEVRSLPSGARVSVNGKELGTTPLLLARRPGDAVTVDVHIDGFLPAQREVQGDFQPNWLAHLSLRPEATWQNDRAVEMCPTRLPDGTWLFVDRAGHVLRRSAELDASIWDVDTDDLSGWLTKPIVHRDLMITASLDGRLRALSIENGSERWKLDDMPCEVSPQLVKDTLAVATTDSQLHAIDLASRRRQAIALPQAPHGELLRHGDAVIVVGERGSVSCISMPDLKTLWQAQVPELVSPSAALAGDTLVVGDDQGTIVGFDALRGQELWRRELQHGLLGAPSAGLGAVFLATRERILRLDLRTGDDLEAIPAPDGAGWGRAPTVTGTRLVAPLAKGDLQVLDAATGQLVYRIAADSRSRLLALPSGELLVSEPDHELRSYGVLR